MKNEYFNIPFATNKINTFTKLKEAGVPTVEWTTNKDTAITWEDVIIARTKITSNAGKGIIFCTKADLPEAKLYTKFIEDGVEYRVHVFNGEVIDYQKKFGTASIKNHDNGTIFIRTIDGEPLKRIEDNEKIAVDAVKALGLDFGAVDIIRKDKKSFVLEVNTACGMEETTLNSYVQAIINV